LLLLHKYTGKKTMQAKACLLFGFQSVNLSTLIGTEHEF
jgi:hypothetical protein